MRRNRTQLISMNDWHSLFGVFRFLLLLGLPFLIGVNGAVLFEQMDPHPVVNMLIDIFPLFILIRWPMIWLVEFALSWHYWFVSAAATAGVFLAASMFVKDIYELKYARNALRYVVSSMFAVRYPELTIDGGELKVEKREENLLVKIGGPGKVLIQPGNAAMFRSLREPGDVALTSTYFLERFNTIDQGFNLEEQQADKDEVSAMTRDGIKVKISDIHFRYRVKHIKASNGISRRPTIDDPYPISDEAMEHLAFNRSVEQNGLEKWNTAVERAVVGSITDFIAANYIDFLTAPREGQRNPRIEIKNELFFRGVQRALDNYGAELLWADVGHVDIIQSDVDKLRTSLWATEWIADANSIRALGEAKRAAYQELGRAEAQAEMIMSITDVVARAVQESGHSNADIRKILLARTSQILDAMNENRDDGRNAA